MRTHAATLVFVGAAVVLAACRPPVTGEPQRQASTFPEPQPQEPITSPQPQEPITDPSRQSSLLPEPQPQSPVTSPEPQDPLYWPGFLPPDEPTAAGQGGETAEPEGAKAKQAPASDAEVLAVAMAINDAQLQMGELAKKKAKSKRAKELATEITTEHQQSKSKMREVQQKAKLTPKRTEAATQLEKDVSEKMSTLRKEAGDDFENVWLAAMIPVYERELGMIEDRLAPAAKNAQVKAVIDGLHATVTDNLAKAKSLQEKQGTGE